MEEEKERRTDGASSSRERAVNLSRSRDPEEMSTDRHEEEKGEEELLKPAWIRCTHAENYYSNDPMDQVVITVVNTNSRQTLKKLICQAGQTDQCFESVIVLQTLGSQNNNVLLIETLNIKQNYTVTPLNFAV